MHRLFKRCTWIFALTVSLAAALCSRHASAQTQTFNEFNDKWQFTVGLGAYNEPIAPGSNIRETLAVPLFSATYDRYFIGSALGSGLPFGIGAYLYKDNHWLIGAAVGRTFYTNTGTTTSANLFSIYDAQYFIVRDSISTDIGGNGEGTHGSMDILAKFSPFKNMVLLAGPGFTWADTEYMQRYYGVTAAQSEEYGYPVYTAAGGVNSVRLRVVAQYNLTPKWMLSGALTLSNLRGDAAKSPLTEGTCQDSAGIFASYRF